MTGHVVVVGSINIDLVVDADHLPEPGETVLGGRFAQHQGGKGANQAVAAARAGARVTLIGAVGDDAHGRTAIEALEAEGIDVSRVRRVEEPTGVALIAVSSRGDNQIMVAPGANGALTAADVVLNGEPGILLTNHEIPMDVVLTALRAAHEAGWIAILNPAPAHALAAEVLALGPILTPNEHELIVAIGNDDSAAGLAELTRRSSGPVIVTQGATGALLAHGERRERFDGYRPPSVVDTTGAGDTFSGVLSAWLAAGSSLAAAIEAANAAAALSVSAAGARGGMPRRAEIEQLLNVAGGG